MRSATLQLLLLASLAAASNCGPATPAPRGTPPGAADAAPPRTGRVLFECTPADAQVVVDGAPWGTAEEISRAGGLTLSLGPHRFEITRAGYQPFRIELNTSEKPERLRVELKPADR